MKHRIVFTEDHFASLHSHLLSRAPAEEAAILLAGRRVDGQGADLLVREVHPVPVQGFATRGSVFLQVDPEFYGPLLKRCRAEGWSFILAHSHPFGPDAGFSGTDDQGEQDLMPRLFARAPERPHGAIVLGFERGSARIWMPGYDRGRPAEIIIRGTRARRADRAPGTPAAGARFDRQARALGDQGQHALAKTKIGLVGLGGLGSQIYIQCKYLGVEEMILIDPDSIQASNLNRLVYATEQDVGRPKVEVAAGRGHQILPSSRDVTVIGDVTVGGAVRELLGCDVVMSATDTLFSRTVMDRLMAQYLLPMIDSGIDIDADGGVIRAIGGRVTRTIPGRQCLGCVGILDPARVASEVDRTYLAGIVAPSVVSLNGVIASLAVNELLDHVTGYAGIDLELPRSLVFDGRRGVVRAVSESGAACGVCTLVLAAGDVERLPIITEPAARTA